MTVLRVTDESRKQARALLVRVEFACNDSGSGTCLERTNDVHFFLEGENDPLAEMNGREVVVRHFSSVGPVDGKTRHRLRFGRLLLKCGSWHEWSGNWCWDGTWVTPKTAVRMFQYLIGREWRIEAGSHIPGSPFAALPEFRRFMS